MRIFRRPDLFFHLDSGITLYLGEDRRLAQFVKDLMNPWEYR